MYELIVFGKDAFGNCIPISSVHTKMPIEAIIILLMKKIKNITYYVKNDFRELISGTYLFRDILITFLNGQLSKLEVYGMQFIYKNFYLCSMKRIQYAYIPIARCDSLVVGFDYDLNDPIAMELLPQPNMLRVALNERIWHSNIKWQTNICLTISVRKFRVIGII